MKFITNNIRSQLIASLSSFALIIVGQLGISFYTLNEMSKLAEVRGYLADVQLNWLAINSNMFRYLNSEVKNPVYHSLKEGGIMSDVYNRQKFIEEDLNALLSTSTIKEIELHGFIDSMRYSFNTYGASVKRMEKKILKKGFKDNGLEGSMRNYVHKLESIPDIPIENVLTIRRHEKDFILRGDESYVSKLKQEVVNLRSTLNLKNERLGLFLLDSYLQMFLEYVDLSKELGSVGDSGLVNTVVKQGKILDSKFDELQSTFERQQQEQMFFLKIVLLGTTILVILLTIYLSVYIGNKLAQPIRALSNKMSNQELQNDQTLGDLTAELEHEPQEIANLERSFIELSNRVKHQMFEIKEKNVELSKQNQSLEKLNKELDRFIYHTSHDLRSPLTAVLGLIEVIELYKEDDITEYLTHMKTSISQLDETIMQIIRFYKNQHMEVVKEIVDLNKLTHRIFDLYKFHPLMKGIEFQSDFKEVNIIHGDSYRLSIVLKNLISNAIKYSDEKKSKCFIKVSSSLINNQCVIEITDNGIGMDSQTKSKVFDMFYRGPSQRNGSGLGLYIIKEALKKMDAEIKLESEKGVGSVFSICIPEVSINQGDILELEGSAELIAQA